MKKSKNLSWILGIFAILSILVAADHIDAPNVRGGSSDITDYYAFQGENTDNIVFVANVQGLLSPTATKNASFDENVMIEFNIDTNNDNVEDLVIQAVRKNSKMYFLGPIAPSETGLVSQFEANTGKGVSAVQITKYGKEASIRYSNDGMKFFAGPRDDPFFFDFGQFSQIIAGNAPEGFNNPGNDTFAGTNVLSIVVEVPKSLLGTTGTINTWVESKRRQ